MHARANMGLREGLKKSFRNTIRLSNSLDPDQDRQIWFQTVCKGYQQITKVSDSKERVNSVGQEISISFLGLTYPDKTIATASLRTLSPNTRAYNVTSTCKS